MNPPKCTRNDAVLKCKKGESRMTMIYMDLLGKKCRDAVTGFTGVVSTVSYDLYGCVQAVVVPTVGKDGSKSDGQWFDCKRLTVINQKPVMDVPNFKDTPLPDVTRRGQERGPAEKPAIRLG